MKLTYQTNTTYNRVFIGNYIFALLLSIAAIWGCAFTKYSDKKMNNLKWLGWLIGAVSQFMLIMLICGIVLSKIYFTIIGLILFVVMVSLFIYIITKNKKDKEQG